MDEGRVEVTFHARVPGGANEDLIELLEAQPGVRRVQVESLN